MLRFLNNPRIDDVLHVILVVSNPCLYKRRYQLARECIARLEKTEYIQVYLVELAYGDQSYALTQSGNPRHLQLRCETPLWHKENMINLGIQKLLPTNWKAVAWIDADIQFLNPNWARNTLEVLRKYNVVQPFDTITYLDANNRPGESHPSCTYITRKTGVYGGHSGFAWAMRRDIYDQLGGLFERAVLGGGDAIMCNAFVHKGTYEWFPLATPSFKTMIADFARRCANVRIGHVPGTILHYFHGTLKNRKYEERREILVRHEYDPYVHVERDPSGLLVPTSRCPSGFPQDILKYFQERNEDDPTGEDPKIPVSSEGGGTSEEP